MDGNELLLIPKYKDMEYIDCRNVFLKCTIHFFSGFGHPLNM